MKNLIIAILVVLATTSISEAQKLRITYTATFDEFYPPESIFGISETITIKESFTIINSNNVIIFKPETGRWEGVTLYGYNSSNITGLSVKFGNQIWLKGDLVTSTIDGVSADVWFDVPLKNGSSPKTKMLLNSDEGYIQFGATACGSSSCFLRDIADVSEEGGTYASFTDSMNVTVTGEEIQPTASFDFEPKHPTIPDAVLPGVPITFTFTPTEGDEEIIEWLWDFNGSPDTSNVEETTFTFNEEGEYTVELEVTDKNEEKGIKTIDIKIICEADKISATPDDCDGDALSNEWETLGVDTNDDGTKDFSLKDEGANPLQKDIFVWIDWLSDSTHSHKPNELALNEVKDIFKRRGINLHTDYGQSHEELSDLRLIMECKLNILNKCFFSYSTAKFNNIRDIYLTSNGNNKGMLGIFHYVLFAHYVYVPSGKDGALNGIAIGSDIVIAHETVLKNKDDDKSRIIAEATTFMHELGHVLGLGHGGVNYDGTPNDHNKKPNHLSIMNYSFAYNGLTIGQKTGELDYSLFEPKHIPSLNENGRLNESKGLNAISLVNIYQTKWYCNDSIMTMTAPANGIINWDCDKEKQITTNAIADINKDGKIGSLSTMNEWNRLNFHNGTIGALALNIPDLPDIMTLESGLVDSSAEIRRAARSTIHDRDGDGIPNEEDYCLSSPISPTIIIYDSKTIIGGGCDTKVKNTLSTDGCNIRDLIDDCEVTAKNHGKFVSCVSKLTKDLVRKGDISNKDKGRIQSCAANAKIP